MNENEFISGLKIDMAKTVESYKKELSRLRTGRASSALIENVNVEYYGAVSPLIRLASVSIADSRTLIIHPWDASSLGNIEKAIQKHDSSLNPSNDGKSITIVTPSLTEERRKEIIKQIGKLSESIKQELRNIRRIANEKIKTLEKEKELSEDASFKLQKKVQETTDNFTEEINKITRNKEKEIMEV